jgi:ribosome-binding factor A
VSDMDARAHKLADRIREIVAELLEKRVKDPRLGFVTVTDARITNDLREATVFYTVYGDEHEQIASQRALTSDTGMLRSEVGRITGVKHTPTLTFVADALPDNARHIEDLLARARAADELVHEQAAAASYAGDPDPYRAPPEESDEESVDGAGHEADEASRDVVTGADRTHQQRSGPLAIRQDADA